MEAQSPFSSELPSLQLAWDSVSRGALKKCLRYYKLFIIEGYRPKNTINTLGPLQFGIMTHSALETYDKARFRGADHTQAQREAVRRALTDSHGYAVVEKDPNLRTRPNLVRLVVWYTDHFKDDAAKTLELGDKPAVELSFRMALPFQAITGETFLHTGHIDKVVDFAGGWWVLDRKHTKSVLSGAYFAKYNPDDQMSGYDIAGKVVLQRPIKGIIIDAIQVGVNFNRFVRGFSPRTDESRDEWLKDLKYWLDQATYAATSGHYPMNDKACDVYGGCTFREVCKQSPLVREIMLKENFIVDKWNPLKNREE